MRSETSAERLPRLAGTALDFLGRMSNRGMRLARHLLVWLLLMVGVTWFQDSLKSSDWALVNLLDREQTPWPAGVELVDLGWDQDPAGLATFRGNLAAALAALARLETPPRVVVVDAALSRLPLGLEPLNQAVRELAARQVELVAATDQHGFSPVLGFDAALLRQGKGRTVYAGRAHFGHTAFDFAGNAYWYRPCLEVPALPDPDRSGTACLPAVPHLVAERFWRPLEQPMQLPAAKAQPVLFQPGAADRYRERVWRLSEGALVPDTPGRELRALGSSVVILGNLDSDLVNCRLDAAPVARVGSSAPGAAAAAVAPAAVPDADAVRATCRRGPELLAWAIGAHIAPSPPDAPRLVVLASAAWTIGFAVVFSLIALAIYALIRRAMAHPERHLLALAFGSAVLTLALLGAWVALLRFGLQAVFVPVSFVAAAVLVTIGIAWHTLREQLRERALYSTVERPPGSEDRQFDVFVSYSHTPAENMDWVEREIVQPLTKATLDGRPLNIFFDKRSIRVGTNWYFEIAYGIQSSRCVLAVYSEDYFNKSFCNFELSKAVTRDIADGGKTFFILPVKRGNLNAVPPTFSHLQFDEFKRSEDVVEAVMAGLRRRLPPPT